MGKDLGNSSDFVQRATDAAGEDSTGARGFDHGNKSEAMPPTASLSTQNPTESINCKPEIQRHEVNKNSAAPRWHESRSTTVNGSEAETPATSAQERSSLLPPLDERDETGLSDAPGISTHPSRKALEGSQLESPGIPRRRHALGDTVGKLRKQCEMVLGVRLKVDQARSSLRRDRQAVGDIDARFMQELRNILSQSQDEKFKTLNDLWEEMETARNELYPDEDDYNKLEDQLSREEYDLTQTQQNLLPILEGARESLLGDNDLDSFLDEEVPDSENKHASLEEELQPEMQEYLSRKGDHDIVSERITELRMERTSLVEEERRRAPFDLTLDEESRRYLDGFDARHNMLQEELAEIERDMAKMELGLACRDNVFFATTRVDISNEVAEHALDRVEDLYQELPFTIVPAATAAPIAVAKPSLPPTPSKVQTSTRDALLLGEDDTTPVFHRLVGFGKQTTNIIHQINDWLLREQGNISAAEFFDLWSLNTLRTSFREVTYYKLQLEQKEVYQWRTMDQDAFRDLVLYWWYFDGAAKDSLRRMKLEARGISLSVGSLKAESRRAESDTTHARVNKLARRLYQDGVILQVGNNVQLTMQRARSE